MSMPKESAKIGDCVSLIKAVIQYKNNPKSDGTSLSFILIKVIKTIFKETGYVFSSDTKEAREDLMQDLLEFSINKIQNNINIPTINNEYELRLWNKKVYNYLKTCISYEIKGIYRTKMRRQKNYNSNIEKIISYQGAGAVQSAKPVDEQIECPYSEIITDPFQREVAKRLALGFVKTTIAKDLHVGQAKVQDAIEKIKLALTDNI